MAYKTILLVLLFIFFSKESIAQYHDTIRYHYLELSIDSVINEAIRQKAFPGCVVFASHHGKPFFNKGYGYHTYDSMTAVRTSHLYDIASITKVSAATLAIMKLYDDGLIDLDIPVGEYVDGLGRSDYAKLTIRQLLAHQGGAQSWIRFYERTKRKNGQFKKKTLTHHQSDEYPYPVSEALYLHKDYHQQIKKMIKHSPVQRPAVYEYSGLFFYLVPELVKNLAGISLDDFLNDHFFDAMNLDSLVFNPLDHFDLEETVPTEIDTFFRMEPIHGRVHDEGAILMAGVSGNAGQFATASALSQVFHMLLNDGAYDSLNYLSPQTIQLFTSCQYPNRHNRRALGFDKPLLHYDAIKSSVAAGASVSSYGHSGYTGTLVWADPANGLLFIFLSNRVYPTRKSRGIYELNVRPTIHQYFYDFLDEAYPK